ncbi:MAG: carboxypeptidase-like regulatory domain-containing protein, partial [Candidatus Zixiibacteriota bacterium]
MKRSLIALAGIALLLVAPTVFGDVVGTITGSVTDAKSGEPLVGVSVAVKGTSLGAMTDVDGKYLVMNVPVGTYEVSFSMVGFGTIGVSGVDVHADLAAYVDQGMSSEAADIGKTISVVAETPMVVRDKTATI